MYLRAALSYQTAHGDLLLLSEQAGFDDHLEDMIADGSLLLP